MRETLFFEEKGRIVTIDLLRFLAVILMFYRLTGQPQLPPIIGFGVCPAHIYMDIFLFCSGFVNYLRYSSLSPSAFLVKRLKRLYAPFCFFVFFAYFFRGGTERMVFETLFLINNHYFFGFVPILIETMILFIFLLFLMRGVTRTPELFFLIFLILLFFRDTFLPPLPPNQGVLGVWIPYDLVTFLRYHAIFLLGCIVASHREWMAKGGMLFSACFGYIFSAALREWVQITPFGCGWHLFPFFRDFMFVAMLFVACQLFYRSPPKRINDFLRWVSRKSYVLYLSLVPMAFIVKHYFDLPLFGNFVVTFLLSCFLIILIDICVEIIKKFCLNSGD